MLIKTGSAMLAPRPAKMADDVAVHIAEKGQVSLAPEIVTRRTSVKARKGESVASIARRYKLPAADVASWNQVSAKAAFKAGEQVVVFLPVHAARPSRSSASGHAGPSTARKLSSHPVKRGGTPAKRRR